MLLRSSLSSFYLFIAVLIFSGCTNVNEKPLTAPAGFAIAEGFQIELLVGEPLISDPVDMEIDEMGRLFVVEMHGYPLDKSGSGKIKQVIDSDGDGTFDKSIVFVDGLVLPNSIMRWKKGFIVTDAPHVLYFEDTDNDGKADKADTLLTGFALSNPQHNLNSPLLGIDNWIYLAHEGAVGTETFKNEFGDRGREIYFPGKPNGPRLAVNAGGRSVRFQPEHYKLEMTSSHSQFGHSFDAWGHHLQVGNSNHIYQEVIAEQYLQRNPDLLISDATQSLSDHGEAAEVFPITQNPQHQLLTDVGVITSACGIHAYLGGEFPAPYDHAVFVAEPVSNIVHVDHLSNDKSIFKAQRIFEHSEFLASTDPKFRPVNIYTGPDGALYIVDYYRQIIEHPEWMGDEVVKSGALYNDSDKGRIYRITSKEIKPPAWIKGVSLGEGSVDSLVNTLDSKNSWWRMNAQRLLIDRNDKGIVPRLESMATDQAKSFGRLHALWTLEGMGALNAALIRKALKDSIEGIRENAIRLAEFHLDKHPELVEDLIAMQTDKSARLRLQLICTLAGVDNPKASESVRNILLGDVEDPWVQVAALTSNSKQVSALLSLMIDKSASSYKKSYGALIGRMAGMIGAKGSSPTVHEMIEKVNANRQAPWADDMLVGLSDGLENRKSPLALLPNDIEHLVSICLLNDGGNGRAAFKMLKHSTIANNFADAAIRNALKIAVNQKEKEGKRASAIDLISLKSPASHVQMLKDLIRPTEPMSVQLAAIRTMSDIQDNTVGTFLIGQWKNLTPGLREAGISTFLDEDSRIALLLDALQDHKIQVTELAWYQKVGLMAHRNIPLRDRARKLLTSNDDSAVNKSYEEALTMMGDPNRGMEIFNTQCGICHQIRGKGGIALGPDLGTVHNWSKEAIMSNILAPSKSISSGYELWSVEMKNGERLQGIIASETPGAITLKNTNQWAKTISRPEIKSLTALNLSVMPGDISKQIDHQQMASLLAYLKQNK